MRRSHGKYQRTSLHSNDDDDDDDDDNNDNLQNNNDTPETLENSTTHRGCLQYQKVFSSNRLQNRNCVTVNEATTIVNNNRDLSAGLGGGRQQTKPAIQIINNSFDDEGDGTNNNNNEEQRLQTRTEREEGSREGVEEGPSTSRAAERGRYRQRFEIGLCTARRSWLGFKSSPGDAFSTQSRYSGRRRLDKLRSWTRSNNYSGVSFKN